MLACIWDKYKLNVEQNQNRITKFITIKAAPCRRQAGFKMALLFSRYLLVFKNCSPMLSTHQGTIRHEMIKNESIKPPEGEICQSLQIVFFTQKRYQELLPLVPSNNVTQHFPFS